MVFKERGRLSAIIQLKQRHIDTSQSQATSVRMPHNSHCRRRVGVLLFLPFFLPCLVEQHRPFSLGERQQEGLGAAEPKRYACHHHTQAEHSSLFTLSSFPLSLSSRHTAQQVCTGNFNNKNIHVTPLEVTPASFPAHLCPSPFLQNMITPPPPSCREKTEETTSDRERAALGYIGFFSLPCSLPRHYASEREQAYFPSLTAFFSGMDASFCLPPLSHSTSSSSSHSTQLSFIFIARLFFLSFLPTSGRHETCLSDEEQSRISPQSFSGITRGCLSAQQGFLKPACLPACLSHCC